MKVITEEDLIARRNKFIKQCKNIAACIVDELLYDCKELDTVTVSKLRPMCDLLKLKDYKTEVLATRDSETFMRIRQSSDDEVYCFKLGKYFPSSQFIGWIHAPVINLEELAKEMIWPDACG